MKKNTIRSIVAAAAVLLIVVGMIAHFGIGTLSSLGYEYIASVCPVGALEALLGARGFVPRIVIGLVAMVLLIVVFGKAFCGWICPVPHLSKFASTKRQRDAEEQESHEAAETALENYQQATGEDASIERPKRKMAFDSRHGVLLATLASAAIFGFPVFCLICPVGLTFATLFAMWNLVGFNDVSWGVLLFPLILLVEMLFLRKRCMRFCPLGALLSLFAPLNKTFVPKVDRSKCLRTSEGVMCSTCSKVCPEHADPNSDLGLRPMSECSKCGDCVKNCPAHAISIPFLPKTEKKEPVEVEQ